jgi:hypothetical protein
VRIVNPRIASSSGWAIASSSPTAMALDGVLGRDLGVPEVDAPATAGQPVQGPRPALGDQHRKPPEHEARVAVSDRAV